MLRALPSMPLRLLRRVLLTSALAITFVLCLPSIARAQAIGVFQEQSLPRIDKDGKTVAKRPITLKPEGVNYQDCIDDQKIRFPLQLGSFEGNASLQVWAGLGGADCKNQQNRTGINATCWPLVTGVPLQVNPIVDIPVRAIMSGAPPFKPAEPATGADMCGKIDLAQISVQFLYFSPGQLATPSQSKDMAVEVDTIGPAAPTGLRTEPGNGRITVRWDNISGEGGLSVLTGVRVYCDEVTGGGTTPPPADSGTTNEPAEASCEEVPNEPDANFPDADAGTTTVCEDAGSSTTEDEAGTPSTATSCSSPNWGSDIIPDAEFNAKFGCGQITGNAGTSVIAEKLGGQSLKNRTADSPEVTYAVAVAATDAFNNVGPLSSPICEYPEPTTDFWENYRKAGGDAGGGCTTSGAPIGSMSAMTVIGLVAFSALRRRWSARRDGR